MLCAFVPPCDKFPEPRKLVSLRRSTERNTGIAEDAEGGTVVTESTEDTEGARRTQRITESIFRTGAQRHRAVIRD